MRFEFVGMTTLGLRECGKLEGVTNFTSWKYMLQMLLEEVELWKHIETKIIVLTNPKLLTKHNKEDQGNIS